MMLSRYSGPKMYLGDQPEIVQRAFKASLHRTTTFYGGTVDTQMTYDRFRLCEATADYLYSKHTPRKIEYRRGTRPELEQFAAQATKGKRDERERVLGILRFVRDLHEMRPGAGDKGALDPFHGGREEEVIKKGSNMCNEQSRVFCCLCQVAGIPARYVGHHVGGHGVSEAYVDGAWAYFDNRGKYFEKRDGSLASTWEVWQNTSLIRSQPKSVQADVRAGVGYDTSLVYFSQVGSRRSRTTSSGKARATTSRGSGTRRSCATASSRSARSSPMSSDPRTSSPWFAARSPGRNDGARDCQHPGGRRETEGSHVVVGRQGQRARARRLAP